MNLGYHREVRFENAELDGLKLLITSAMPYVSAKFLSRALLFVEKGENDDEFLSTMITHYADKAGVTERYDVSEGTIVAPRIDSSGRKFWVVVNMNGQGGKLNIPKGSIDASNNQLIGKNILNFSPYEWRAIYVNS